MASFRFCDTYLLHIRPFVDNKSAIRLISPFLPATKIFQVPFQNWYTANTNHFNLTDSVRWKSKIQLG